MNELKVLTAINNGVLPPPPLPLPPRTSFFLKHNGQIRSTLDYFSYRENQSYRGACQKTIIDDGGTHIMALLTNTDKNVPVNFFEGVYGGHVSMGALTFLEHEVRMIAGMGGAFWPIIFCDENENAVIRNASFETHQRAFGLFIAHTRPYVPGFVIGIEMSEYFDKNRCNEFVRLIKHFAPDRYVAMHSQAIPQGGMPDVDAWFYEASWRPGDGDNHSPEELLAEVKKAASYGKYVWPVETNWNRDERARAQNRLLLANGFGIGGPV